MTSHKPLIGREKQVDEFEEIFASALRGEGGAVLVSGEEGCGKSRLIRDGLEESGFRVLVGRSYSQSNVPFQPFIEIAEKSGVPFSFGEGSARQSGSDPKVMTVERLEDCDLRAYESALLESLREVAGEGPTCLLLEDLQWSDHATCDWIPCVVEAFADQTFLLIGVYRSEEIQGKHSVRRLRNELKRRGLYREIELTAFGPKETDALIERLLGVAPSRSLIRIIQQRTRGIPLFIEEFCDLLESKKLLIETPQGLSLGEGAELPMPEGVRDAIMMKLGTLSDRSRAMIEAAAVYGDSLDFENLLAVEDSVEALDELLQSGLLIESESGKGKFRHALLREAILEEIPWTHKRILHQRFSKTLVNQNSPSDVVAHHLLGAGEREAARAVFLESADRAYEIGAFGDSLVLYRQALDLWDAETDSDRRLEAVQRLAQSAQLTGQLEEAKKAWREILESDTASLDLERVAQANKGLATTLALEGRAEQAAPYHREAARLFEEMGDKASATLEWLESCGLATLQARYTQALADADRAKELATETRDDNLLALAIGSRAFVLALKGDREEAYPEIDTAFQHAIRSENPQTLANVYQRLAYVHNYFADYSEATKHFRSAADICHRNDLEGQAEFCMGCMAFAVMKTGDWKEAARICREVLNSEDGDTFPRTVAAGTAGVIAALRGEKRKARKLLEESDTLSHQIGLHVMPFYSRWGLALLAEEEGRDDSAREHYQKIFEIWENSEDRYDVVSSLYTASTYFSQRGLKKDLDRCVHILGEIVSVSGNPEPLAAFAFVQGEKALAEDHPDEAAKHFIQALERIERMNLPLESVFASTRLGQTLLQTGDREKGREHLERALQSAKKLGARPLASRIKTLLEDRKGATASSSSDGNPKSDLGLTRRQKEVAKLLAVGLTNKEIANQLFISTRTVDMHVGHLLDRLDCRTRTEAAKKLVEVGLA